MSKVSMDLITKCIGLRHDQVDWCKDSDINFSKLMRRLVDKEIELRSLKSGEPTDDEKKIQAFNNIFDHFGVSSIDGLHDLIGRHAIIIEFIDRRKNGSFFIAGADGLVVPWDQLDMDKEVAMIDFCTVLIQEYKVRDIDELAKLFRAGDLKITKTPKGL